MYNLTTKLTLTLLTLYCLFFSHQLAKAQCHIDDWTALKALYEATDGDNWINNDGWDVVKTEEPSLDCDLDKLYGVELSNNKRVHHLQLSDNNLTGTIPVELEYLSEAWLMNLQLNQLEGNIPDELVNFSYCNIQSNYFNCNDLGTYFNSNQFKSSFQYSPQKYRHNGLKFYPNESINESILLSAPFNQTGNFSYQWFRYQTSIESATDSILHLNNIQQEDLGLYLLHIIDNDCIEFDNADSLIYDYVEYISEPIIVGRDDTKCHFDDWTALKALYEATNGDNWDYNEGWDIVKNDEPPLDCNLNNLYGVTLDRSGRVLRIYDGGNLNGYLPPELSKLKNLEELNFTNAKLNGVIPPELGNLVNLKELGLEDNQLTGNIPPELGNLNNLVFLYLNNNQLTGNIPPELSNLNSLDVLSLNDNQLSGSIPDAIFNMSNLGRLELQNNELTGSISIEVGNLIYINELDFSNNQLTGNIPSEIGNLRYLSSIDFSYNQLDGEIPDKLDNGVRIINLSNNQLTGTFSRELMDIMFLSYFNVSHNKLSGRIPKLIEIDFSEMLYYNISYNNYRCTEIVDSILHVESPIGWGETNYTPQNYNYIGENNFLIDSSKASLKLSAPFSQIGNFSYQWYKNETIVDGAIDSILIINNVQFEDVGNYSLHIFDADCKHNGNDGWGALEGLEYISNPITVRRTDLEGCTDEYSCNYNQFAMIDDGSCEYIWCDTLTNPIKIKTTNEQILSEHKITFDLVIDSLGQDYSADGLTFTLDTRGNYKIESVEVISPNLLITEVDVSQLYENTLSIDRSKSELLASNSPLLKVTALIIIEDIPTDEETCSHFHISGGTELSSGHFISFDNVYIDIPFSNCFPYGGYGAEGKNWLPLVSTISPQNCKTNTNSLVEIKILEEGQSPFSYILKDENDSAVLQDTSNENLFIIRGLNAGKYKLTVTDANGKTTTLNTCIPLIASLNGNDPCISSCVDYVTVPNGLIKGNHQAKKEIEIKGYVGKNETAEFSICD